MISIKHFKFLLLILISIFIISGCKASNNDLNKEVERLSKTIEKEKVFNDDYSLLGTISDGNKLTSYTLTKASNNYYVKIDINNYKIETWTINNNNNYYFYFNNGKDKYYKIIESEEVVNAIEETFKEKNLTVNSSLKQFYTNVLAGMKVLIDKCNEVDTKYVCSIEKKFFYKTIFTIKYANEIGESETQYLLKKGKIVKVKSQFSKGNYLYKSETEIDYSKQKIAIPNNQEYVLK